jgi:hypothetical protein
MGNSHQLERVVLVTHTYSTLSVSGARVEGGWPFLLAPEAKTNELLTAVTVLTAPMGNCGDGTCRAAGSGRPPKPNPPF